MRNNDVSTRKSTRDANAGLCEYFTKYGNNGVPGECKAAATLKLVDNGIPPICVCREHAHVIVSRFPELGDVAERFAAIR